MPDILAIISKAQFEASWMDAAPGDRLGIDRYTSTNKLLGPLEDGGSLFLITVRPPRERLWLVGILEAPRFSGEAWRSEPSSIAIVDISGVRDQLRFTTGAGIQVRPGALG